MVLVCYLEHSAEQVVNSHFQVKIASQFNLSVSKFPVADKLMLHMSRVCFAHCAAVSFHTCPILRKILDPSLRPLNKHIVSRWSIVTSIYLYWWKPHYKNPRYAPEIDTVLCIVFFFLFVLYLAMPTLVSIVGTSLCGRMRPRFTVHNY